MDNNLTIIDNVKLPSLDRPLIIDCFLYNGDPITELRLEYLYKYVDLIIVVEAKETHSGVRKDFLYLEKNSEIFDKYNDKLIKVIIEKLPETNNPWLKETYNRDCIQPYILKKLQDNKFIIMVCDVDEIPRIDVINKLHTVYDIAHNGIHLQMELFKYGFRWKKNIKWYHPFITTDKGTQLFSFDKLRTSKLDGRHIINAGWHVTYCFGINDMIRKLESISHLEFNKSEYKKRDYIKTCMLTGRFILDTKGKDVLIPYYGNDLPTGWQEFQAKMDTMIFDEEFNNIK